MSDPRKSNREVRAPRGPDLTCRQWTTEAPYRMLMNNLDAEVAENPHELVVYGGIGRAARTWKDFDLIVSTLKTLNEDETLIVQSGRPVAVIKTHENAPQISLQERQKEEEYDDEAKAWQFFQEWNEIF